MASPSSSISSHQMPRCVSRAVIMRSFSPPSIARHQHDKLSCVGMGPNEAFLHGSEESEPNIFVFTPEGSLRILGKPGKAELRRPVDQMLARGTTVCDVGSICLGATFMVAATNGLDITRRMNFQGFCQSPDILGECIEDAVLHRGGEILEAEKLSRDGAEQRLVMTVALPLLFGIPPEMDTLKSAIEVGGGFLHKMYGEWYIY